MVAKGAKPARSETGDVQAPTDVVVLVVAENRGLHLGEDPGGLAIHPTPAARLNGVKANGGVVDQHAQGLDCKKAAADRTWSGKRWILLVGVIIAWRVGCLTAQKEGGTTLDHHIAL